MAYHGKILEIMKVGKPIRYPDNILSFKCVDIERDNSRVLVKSQLDLLEYLIKTYTMKGIYIRLFCRKWEPILLAAKNIPNRSYIMRKN